LGDTHHPGIDEGKIDRLTLHVSLYAFQGARTYDACLQFGCIPHMFEKGDMDRRGEMWISIGFHNLPTVPCIAYKVKESASTHHGTVLPET